MELQDYFNVLSDFCIEIGKVIGQIDLNKIDYDPANSDEKFLFDELSAGVLDNLLYAKDTINYLSKKVTYSGYLKKHNGYFYIDDIKLKEHDTVEAFVSNEWRRMDVFLINREYYISLEAGSNIIGLKARIRLAEKELDMRKTEK